MRSMSILTVCACMGIPALGASGLSWESPNRYRTLLTVDPRGVARSHSPVSVELDFEQLLAAAGGTGVFDHHTIEVIAYEPAGSPRVFDASRGPGDDQFLLPWRIDRRYQTSRLRFSFVMPDSDCTRFAVYFDTVQSRLGQPQRYSGLVGDGDWFTEGYKRREINACGYDTWSDLDGDGDLDLFKAGTEPFVYCYENVGGSRFVDRGKLTSGGDVLQLPTDGDIRTWASIEFCDWDRDGDQDLFMSGSYSYYGGDSGLKYYQNIGSRTAPVFAPPVAEAFGLDVPFYMAYPAFADIDSDGDEDLFVGVSYGIIVYYENTEY